MSSKDVDHLDENKSWQKNSANPAVDGLPSIKKDETSGDTQLLKTLRAENASLAEAVKALNREKADMHQFHSQVREGPKKNVFLGLCPKLWVGGGPKSQTF